MKKWMYNTLLGIFAAVFIISTIGIGVYLWNSQAQKDRYNDLAQLRPTDNQRPLPTQSATPGETLSQEQTQPSAPRTAEVTNPKTGETMEILVEFKELYEMNSDIIGWLRIPAINVDYPVMFTPDSPSYYLRRNFDKEKQTAGCLYVQEDCDVFTPSDNVIIGGHNMRDGTMFGELDKFAKADFAKENPYIYFDTLTELHTYEIMAVFTTTVSVGKGFPYYNFINAESQEEFDEFVAKCKKLAKYDTGVDAVYGDKLICLTTCEYSQTNGRLVVVAKRVA